MRRFVLGLVATITISSFGVCLYQWDKVYHSATRLTTEHKTKYYIKEADHGVICIHADSTWQGDFITFCTVNIEEAMELTQKLNDAEKGIIKKAVK